MPEITPGKSYRVTVKRAIRIGKLGTTILAPRNENLVTGEVLATLPPDDVLSFEEVPNMNSGSTA
jgi:hypothetical protein